MPQTLTNKQKTLIFSIFVHYQTRPVQVWMNGVSCIEEELAINKSQKSIMFVRFYPQSWALNDMANSKYFFKKFKIKVYCKFLKRLYGEGGGGKQKLEDTMKVKHFQHFFVCTF